MATGHAPLPDFVAIEGLRIGVANAGIKQTARPDITVFELADTASVAGVFTKNAFCAAPVQLCRQHLSAGGAIRYLLVNTGNANAGTGSLGMDNALASLAALAELTGAGVQQILPFSTGVIGEHLPVEKISQALPAALACLSADNWAAAASAIMTTDTRPKGVSRSIDIAGHTVTINGISKGAGMIKPNMATMLAFVALDAVVSPALLQQMVAEACRLSFNRITIDGDTSTNDSAILVATGKGSLDADALGQQDLWLLQQAINLVFVELAQLIVRDGEGATKFVHVHVSGGCSEQECEQVAFTIAESPLVKTALFASDPNWGRILAAVGRSGIVDLDVDKVSLAINQVLIAENGGRAASYTEQAGVAALAPEDIHIEVNLRRGDAAATVWTTDLSHDYVTINAEYRT